jgi:hypothetical protein
MREADFKEFAAMLDAVCGLLSRGTYKPDAQNTALFFRALSSFTLAEVRAGLDAHVSDPQRGRFVPVPADVIAQIVGRAEQDGRPGADEAWALAMSSRDESRTVVWTAEVSEAWGIARHVLTAGDEVGARVAFRDAYNRLVEAARSKRKAPEWQVSFGFDAQQREAALIEAHKAGLLPAPQMVALPAPDAFAPLVGNPEMPEELRAKLAALRERALARLAGPTQADIDRERTAALQQEAARRVAQYQGHPA